MELKLLSSDEEDLVDPDEEKIRIALTRLPELSDGVPARGQAIRPEAVAVAAANR